MSWKYNEKTTHNIHGKNYTFFVAYVLTCHPAPLHNQCQLECVETSQSQNKSSSNYITDSWSPEQYFS